MIQNKYLPCLLAVIFSQFLFAGEIRNKTETAIHEYAGKDVSLAFQKLSLGPIIKKKIEQQAGQQFFKDHVYVWKISDTDSLKGYAVLDNVYGKSMPITFLVILNDKGEIKKTLVIKYREAYGGQISSTKWLRQFNSKDKNSNYNIGKDIDGISGATISVNALSKGIKKLVLLFPYIQKYVN